MVKIRCGNCKWWDIDSELEEKGSNIGWCVRYPPIFKGKVTADNFTLISDWPKTAEFQWCGEFKTKGTT